MATTLIIDIETVGEKWSSLDTVTQEILLRWVHRTVRSEAGRTLLETDIKLGLGFSPLTGFIVAIGVYDLERERGVVYYTGEGTESDITVGEYILKERTEAAMLSEFWEGALQYDTFVTFNGRAFDAPFLAHRSVVQGISPTKNLLEGRYPRQQRSCRHVDLQDELTFFGAMQRRPSLHLFCRAYGITSPKGEIGGDDVADLFSAKRYHEIAVYNAKDVIATTALYRLWLQHLAPKNVEPDIDY